MPRFFKEYFESAPYIEGDDARHVVKSLRMKPGDSLTVCDTRGTDYLCEILSCGDTVELKIKEKRANITEPSVFVTLYQCLAKGDKMDTVVRQAVETGISRIVPVLSANCVSRPDPATLQKKRLRWQKIADEAAGQCGRGILPLVDGCVELSAAAKQAATDDLRLFFYEMGGRPVAPIGEDVKTVSVFVGPEGGFTAAEAETLLKNGAVQTTLGPRILRAETAPVAAAAVIMLQSGNMK